MPVAKNPESLEKSGDEHPFGRRLVVLRERLGLGKRGRSRFADLIAVPVSTVQSWESLARRTIPPEADMERYLAAPRFQERYPQVDPKAVTRWLIDGGADLPPLRPVALQRQPEPPPPSVLASGPAERGTVEAAILQGIADRIVEPAEATVALRVLRRVGLAVSFLAMLLGTAQASPGGLAERSNAPVLKNSSEEPDEDEAKRRREGPKRAARRRKRAKAPSAISKVDAAGSHPFSRKLLDAG